MAQFRSKPFGVTQNGDKVDEYIISNPGGLEISVLNYGCVIKNLFVPTKRVWWMWLSDTTPSPTMRRISTHPAAPAAVRSWAGMPTALKMRNFLSAARPTSWKPTMAKSPARHLPRKIYDVKMFGDTLLMETESPAGEDGFPEI